VLPWVAASDSQDFSAPRSYYGFQTLLKLDLYTLDVVTIINLLATSAAMFLIWSLNRRVDGLRRSAIGFVLLGVGFATIPLRIYFSGKAVILMPNLIGYAGAVFILDGIRTFRGFRRETGLILLWSVTFMACMCYWLFIEDKMNARVAAGSLFWAVVVLWCAYSMAVQVPPRDRRVYWPSALIFAVEGVALLIRAVTGLSDQPDSLGFMRSIMETVSLFTLNLCTIGCAFGLSMATNLKLQRDTERLAFHDSLTDLPNRRLFEERLEEAERRAFDEGTPIALIYCDVDDFKGINDTLGHEGGDMALRMVGDRLRRAVSEDVCLARLGGDEFVLLVENARSRDQINALIERLRLVVESSIEFGGRTATVRISCGAAIYPDDVGSVSDLIRLADAGMYMMKQHGRFVPDSDLTTVHSAQTRSI